MATKDQAAADSQGSAACEDESTWGFVPGQQIVPGLQAWEVLGVGRRHEMWLAWCATRWREVAVKLPRRDSMRQSTFQALDREGAIAGELVHPGIVRLLERRPRHEAAHPHLVYEYIEGPQLSQILAGEGPLEPPDVVRLGMQLASTLHYMHGRGVVHLDLKPDNLVVREGRVVILDFDITLPVGGVRSSKVPRGTPPYMAPEQILCRPAAPSMDLWALGAVLYESASNTKPFEVTGEGDDRFFGQLWYPPPSLRRAGLPANLDRLIQRLLDPSPEARPASAAAVMSLLAEALPAGEEGVWPPWATPPIPAPARRVPRQSLVESLA